jgi:hypothetical protein
MPFAGDDCPVTGSAQNLTEGSTMLHILDAHGMLILAGQKGCPRRTALGAVIELRKPHSTCCQFIEVRRPDFSAETSDIGVSQIIGHNKDNIWLFGRATSGLPRHGFRASGQSYRCSPKTQEFEKITSCLIDSIHTILLAKTVIKTTQSVGRTCQHFIIRYSKRFSYDFQILYNSENRGGLASINSSQNRGIINHQAKRIPLFPGGFWV